MIFAQQLHNQYYHKASNIENSRKRKIIYFRYSENALNKNVGQHIQYVWGVKAIRFA